jgi:hypothetical protein
MVVPLILKIGELLEAAQSVANKIEILVAFCRRPGRGKDPCPTTRLRRPRRTPRGTRWPPPPPGRPPATPGSSGNTPGPAARSPSGHRRSISPGGPKDAAGELRWGAGSLMKGGFRGVEFNSANFPKENLLGRSGAFESLVVFVLRRTLALAMFVNLPRNASCVTLTGKSGE